MFVHVQLKKVGFLLRLSMPRYHLQRLTIHLPKLTRWLITIQLLKYTDTLQYSSVHFVKNRMI